MNLIEQLGLRALHRIDPERAHALSLRALGMGIVSLPGVVTSPRLVTHFAGLTMPNPMLAMSPAATSCTFDANASRF